MEKLIVWGSVLAIIFGIISESSALLGGGSFVLFLFFGFKILYGATKWGARTTSNAISAKIQESREEKEWKRNLAREIERERELGKVRNEATIQLMEANTRALIEQAKAGQQVQHELLANYHRLDALGDASFGKLKSEIRGLKIMANEDFRL